MPTTSRQWDIAQGIFSFPAETVRHIWLPLRLSAISCFLPRLLYTINGFLLRLSVWFCFVLRLSSKHSPAECLGRKPFSVHSSLWRKEEVTDSLSGSQIWQTVPAGSGNWQTSFPPCAYCIGNHSFPGKLAGLTGRRIWYLLVIFSFIWKLLYELEALLNEIFQMEPFPFLIGALVAQ